GDLDDVTGGQLLEVGLVATRPVGGLLRVRGAQHLEHPVQPLLADDVADTHEVAVLGRDLDGQIALRDLQLEVLLLFALDLSQLDRKSTRLNSSHVSISYAVFCLKK